MARNPNKKEYRDKLKALRPFVSFNYDLRVPLHSSQKAKINRYYAALAEINARDNRVFRSKNRQRVRMAQEFGQNEFQNLPDFKVAFLDDNQANPIERVRFARDRISVTRKYFREELILFNANRLARDPEKEIARAIAESPGAFTYRIAAGKFVIAQPRKAHQLPAEIKKLMMRYGMDPTTRIHKDAKSAKNHYWKNWLIGIKPLYPENQKQLDDFRIRERDIKRKKEKARRAAKERARVKREKEKARRAAKERARVKKAKNRSSR